MEAMKSMLLVASLAFMLYVNIAMMDYGSADLFIKRHACLQSYLFKVVDTGMQ